MKKVHWQVIISIVYQVIKLNKATLSRSKAHALLLYCVNRFNLLNFCDYLIKFTDHIKLDDEFYKNFSSETSRFINLDI